MASRQAEQVPHPSERLNCRSRSVTDTAEGWRRIIVTFATSDRVWDIEVDCVIDQTALGDVVGIEILDLRSQLRGGSPPLSPVQGLPRWSYDDEIDAFYVRIADGTAPIQKPLVGRAVLDSDNRLTSLEVNVGP